MNSQLEFFFPGYSDTRLISSSDEHNVFRAAKNNIPAKVILKTPNSQYPSPNSIQKLHREFEILNKIDSDHVIKAISLIHKDAEKLYLLELEDINAITLAEYAQTHSISLGQILSIAEQIAQALFSIHQKNIIHKNINPNNIIVVPETGLVKLIDFSIASQLSRETPYVTNPNLLEGTLPYSSPEQTGRMNRTLDYRSDYYSFGVTLYEMLVGRKPFESDDPMEVIHFHLAKQITRPVKPKHAIPNSVWHIIEKLLAKTPELRYQNGKVLIADLKQCQMQLEQQGNIDDFNIANHDISDQFHITQKLYGREPQINTLMEVFNRAARGASELMLVTGYSGIGKTSLVSEIHKPIVEQKGFFVTGKFDQYRRDIPFSAILNATSQLISQILTESDETISIFRSQLQDHLEDHASTLAEILPELVLILGQPNSRPATHSIDSEQHMMHLFAQFLKVFAKREHPLVIFLDDLQWIDPASLKLIHFLMQSGQLESFMLIGAYRNNEVDNAHPLIETIAAIQHSKPVWKLSLGPLSLQSINEILSDTLQRSLKDTLELAKLIHDKTKGNPFFTNQFLYTIYEENILYFDSERIEWNWDIEKISTMEVSENVLDLMVSKIQKFSPATHNLLRLASCLGSQFDLKTLAEISGYAIDTTLNYLLEALESGLIKAQDFNYKYFLHSDSSNAKSIFNPSLSAMHIHFTFYHDRVREAAYTLLPTELRQEIHLKTGRLLLKRFSKSLQKERDDELFNIIDHLNQGLPLVKSSSEKLELAVLNLEASQKAIASTANAAALFYAQKGYELLPPNAVEAHYNEWFELSRAKIETLFLCGRVKDAEEIYLKIKDNIKEQNHKIDLYILMERVYQTLNDFQAGMEVGNECMMLYGFNLPYEDAEAIAEVKQEELKKALKTVSKMDMDSLLNLPELENKDFLKVFMMLDEFWTNAYLAGNLDASDVAGLMIMNLTLKYGNNPNAAFGYIIFAGILSSLDDYERAFEFGLLAKNLNRKYNQLELIPKVNNMFGHFVSHYRQHMKKNVAIFHESYEVVLKTGDIAWGVWGASFMSLTRFTIGMPLEQVAKSVDTYLEYLESTGDQSIVNMNLFQLQLIRCWQGKTDSPLSLDSEDFSLKELKQYLDSGAFPYGQFWYSLYLGQLYYSMNQPEKALEMTLIADQTKILAPNFMQFCEHHTYHPLILCANYNQANEKQKQVWLKQIDTCIERLEIWAKHAPMNYEHKLFLVKAEKNRITGHLVEAQNFFERSIEAALRDGYIQNAALANELAGKLQLIRRRNRFATAYLEEARFGYTRWGAFGKIKHFDQMYGSILEHVEQQRPDRSTADPAGELTSPILNQPNHFQNKLDLHSLMKAAQSISKEMRLDLLLNQLMKVIIENAGAEKGVLLLPESNREDLTVQAAFDTNSSAMETLVSTPLQDYSGASISVIKYVARTLQPVVLDNASKTGPFQNTEYIDTYKPKSILCTPIINQGNLVCVVYLENNLTSGAFTQDRIEVLNLLSGQAAVSIENALLYQTLEQIVQSRTAELRIKTNDLNSMLQNIHVGIFTLTEGLSIHHEYSAFLEDILETQYISGRNVMQVMFSNCNIAAHRLSQMEGTLSMLIGSPDFLFEANSHLLVSEFEKNFSDGRIKILEVSWDPIIDENQYIEKIMVSVRDTTQIKELQQEADTQQKELTMLGQMLAQPIRSIQDLLNNAFQHIHECKQLIQNTPTKSESVVNELFRNIHTLKGDARTFQFSFVVDAIHEIENYYIHLKSSKHSAWDPDRLLKDLNKIDSILRQYELLFLTKLRGDRNHETGIYLDSELSKKQQALLNNVNYQDQKDLISRMHQLELLQQAIGSEPIEQIISSIVNNIPSLSQSLNKTAPQISLNCEHIRLNSDSATPLREVLMHLFSNSIAHGIEIPEQRTKAGKNTIGRLMLEVRTEADSLILEYWDDGAGLPLNKMKKIASIQKNRDSKIQMKDDEASRLIFEPGFTTSDEANKISGRGVGMDAVNHLIAKMGGTINIVFRDTNEGADFRPFSYKITLPKSCVIVVETHAA